MERVINTLLHTVGSRIDCMTTVYTKSIEASSLVYMCPFSYINIKLVIRAIVMS